MHWLLQKIRNSQPLYPGIRHNVSSPQLPLRLRFPITKHFATLVAGDNQTAIDAVLEIVQNEKRSHAIAAGIFINGPEGCGKTHLLSAAVSAFPGAVYLPIAMLAAQAEAAIMAITETPLVCIDQVEAIAGQPRLEIALFDLFNRMREQGHRLLFAARLPPLHLGIGLPDLVSRLSSLAQFTLKPLSEIQRREVVAKHALQRGFSLEDGVLDFIFRRFPRDLHALFELIDRLDQQSLAQHRRITVPFIKQFIEKS